MKKKHMKKKQKRKIVKNCDRILDMILQRCRKADQDWDDLIDLDTLGLFDDDEDT